MKKLCGFLLLLCLFHSSQSQVSITSAGTAYLQDFNGLASSGTSNTWTDNATVAGWYANRTVYLADAGGSTTGGLFSYGSAASTERALGTLTSGGAPTVQFGVRLVNNTGAAVASFNLAFVGEQWRQTANAQSLVFEYQVGAASLTTGTWTANTAFDFTAPNTGTAGALDGNAAANRTLKSNTLTVAVNNGQEIWLRWTKTGTTSPGLAIDSFAITANAGAVNTIATGAVTAPPFCVDAGTAAPGTVAYTANGTYNTTFSAYLSDASGSFASPGLIGSASVNGANPSGNIAISIPAGTASGTGYRIRVDAVSPAVTGSVSAAFEIINGAKNVTGAGAAGGNAQATVSWTLPSGCFDEVMVVAKASASVGGTPSGDGSAYTASAAFGSGTAFDGGHVVYKGTGGLAAVTGLANGTLYYFKIFTRKGTAWSGGVEVSTTPAAVVPVNPGDIVINQLSPQYNGVSDEYIELVNKTNNTIDLSGLTIRYQSAAGNPAGGNLLATLSGTLLPKRYWLLSPNATITVGQTNGLARDGASTAGMATAAGQIALLRSDGTVIDGVGYGTLTGGTYFETAAAPAPPANGGIRRFPNGADNNNNSGDFVTVANANIFLRNSAAEAPLPVRFANLKAEQRGTSVYVSWSCLSEAGIRDYTVERSTDALGFVAVANVKAMANGGEAVSTRQWTPLPPKA